MNKTWIIIGSAALLLTVSIIISFSTQDTPTKETEKPNIQAEHQEPAEARQNTTPIEKSDPKPMTTLNSMGTSTKNLIKSKAPSKHIELAGTIQVTGSLNNPYILKNGSKDVYLEVTMLAGDSRKHERPPLNIAVVIDRSGSMSGKKLTDAKAAAVYLVENLSEGDKVAIISYGTDVSLVHKLTAVNNDNRQEIIDSIKKVTDSGSTNLEGGLKKGRKQLLGDMVPNGINRILLLSDGLANVGISNVEGLSQIAENTQQKGISISTMGVGVDYNEDLMTAVSKMSGGNYYFIGSDLQGIFAQEFKTMATTVAMETNLELILPEGVTVADVYGYTHKVHNNRVIIPMNSFWAKQEKNLLVKLQVSPNTDIVEISQIRISYHDVEAGKEISKTSSMMSVKTTDDKILFEANRNIKVEERLEEIRIATSYEKAMKLYEEGKRDEASMVIKTQFNSTTTNNMYIKSGNLDVELEQLKSLDKNINTYKPSSKEGKAQKKKSKKRAYDQQRQKKFKKDVNLYDSDLVY